MFILGTNLNRLRHNSDVSHYFGCIDPLGDCPSGNDVVHNTFAERLRDIVELHELTHAIQHIVIACKVGVELLKYGCYVREDKCI